MKPISSILVKENIINPKFEGGKGSKESKELTPTAKRVSLKELELAYYNDGLIFNSVNKILQRMFNQGKFKIVVKDQKIKNFMNEFTENIGNSGSALTWKELLRNIAFNACVFGRAPVENVFNKRDNRIVDFDIINIKSIDYAKDTNKNIVLDNNGRPVGYIQSLPLNHPFDPGVQKLPKNVVPPNNKYIYIPAKKVAMISLYQIGDGFYPVGLVEPIYTDSLRKLNLKSAAANAAYWLGWPILHAKLGNQNHEPNAQQIGNMLKVLKELDYKKQLATPYYYDINVIQGDTDASRSAKENVELFEDEEVSGLGIPKSIAKNSTDKSGTAVQRHLMMSFNLTVIDIADRICESITKNMFKPLAEYEKFDEVPRLVFELSGTDELDAVARRLLRYVDAGILKPDQKIGDLLLSLENLPEE